MAFPDLTAWFHRRRASVRILHDGGLPGFAAEPGLPVSARASLVGAGAGKARQLQGRIWLCLSVFMLVFSGLALRLADVSLVHAISGRKAPAAQTAEHHERPSITDRNGVTLAMNRAVTGLAIETKAVWDARETAEGIASVLTDIDAEALRRRILDKQYVEVRNQLTPAEERALFTLGLPGVVFTDATRRVYPQGALAAHATGYTIAGRGGVAGLEYVADDWRGHELASSLDIRAQQILEEEIATTMAEFSVEHAWGVILNAKTGEVVALASMPSFNPNEVNAAPADHWRNRAMQDTYELGSAFKVLTAAAVIEEGLATPETLYDARRPLKIRDRTISDFHARREVMTLSKVIQHSSNIGIAKAALELGAERERAWLSKLGLTEAQKTELPEYRDPALPARWGPVETATISYGQGIAVTPLQLAAAVSAVVNGGTFRTPTFLRQDGTRQGDRLFSEKTSGEMRMIMRQVITDGTASMAEAPGYYPIGKTATADKPGVGGYRADARLSSFVGAFPGYDPEYVILVSFDEPQGTEATWGYATAGWVAAPAFGRIVARLGPALGIAPVNDDVAFAQFMSGLRASGEITLAMREEEGRLALTGAGMAPAAASGLESGDELDDMARLLAEELGP